MTVEKGHGVKTTKKRRWSSQRPTPQVIAFPMDSALGQARTKPISILRVERQSSVHLNAAARYRSVRTTAAISSSIQTRHRPLAGRNSGYDHQATTKAHACLLR